MRRRPTVLPTIPLALTLALALTAACSGPRYAIETPAAFERYGREPGLKLITADGVMVKAREVENYPKAELPFWVDALRRHLEERGYVAKGPETCFDTRRGRKGCTLTFLLPHGAEDWVLAETIFVVGDRIVLVEAAGPYERYARVEAALAASLVTFDPGE